MGLRKLLQGMERKHPRQGIAAVPAQASAATQQAVVQAQPHKMTVSQETLDLLLLGREELLQRRQQLMQQVQQMDMMIQQQNGGIQTMQHLLAELEQPIPGRSDRAADLAMDGSVA